MTRVGLCVACEHARVIRNRAGSSFWLCRRSSVDPSFPRYPRLPVLACSGFETAGAHVDTPPAGEDHE